MLEAVIIASLALRAWAEAVVPAVLLILNAILGYIQEARAASAIDSLTDRLHSTEEPTHTQFVHLHSEIHLNFSFYYSRISRSSRWQVDWSASKRTRSWRYHKAARWWCYSCRCAFYILIDKHSLASKQRCLLHQWFLRSWPGSIDGWEWTGSKESRRYGLCRNNRNEWRSSQQGRFDWSKYQIWHDRRVDRLIGTKDPRTRSAKTPRVHQDRLCWRARDHRPHRRRCEEAKHSKDHSTPSQHPRLGDACCTPRDVDHHDGSRNTKTRKGVIVNVVLIQILNSFFFFF